MAPRSASASARSPTRPTSAAFPRRRLPLLQGLDVWIVDALRPAPHPSHFGVKQTLRWIERLGVKRGDPDAYDGGARLR